MMHFIKAVKPIIINAKKNVNIATINITTKNIGIKNIESAIIAKMIVPIIPAHR